MNFLSFEFLGLFSIFLLIYWLCQKSPRLQNYLLLIAGYLFIISLQPIFAYILFGYTLFIYLLANILSNYVSNRSIYKLLGFGIAFCFIAFKYYSFLQESLQTSLSHLGIEVNIPIFDLLTPLGLSFYAFHSVSYVVSVCRQEISKASFPELALYLSFFPSIFAGPINRAREFMPQIQAPSRTVIDYKKALLLIVLAILKLFLFSTYLSENIAKPVFLSPVNYNVGQTLIAIYAYTWYIYFNFSGYTNLVTGIAMLLGFRVPINFNAPYLAVDLKDFWMRWHISLSTFIRDYVYIPLGGNRHGFTNTNVNIFLAIVISGIWHGAGQTFIIWGAIHGLGVVLLKIKHKIFPPKALTQSSFWTSSGRIWIARIITFHFVCLTWIFFGSDTLDNAVIMLSQFLSADIINSLFANAPMIITFWLVFIMYPKFIALYQWFGRHCQEIPFYWYPVPIAIFLTLVFILSPSGIPNFIYASF